MEEKRVITHISPQMMQFICDDAVMAVVTEDDVKKSLALVNPKQINRIFNQSDNQTRSSE